MLIKNIGGRIRMEHVSIRLEFKGLKKLAQ
jgi:hypothetical protein